MARPLILAAPELVRALIARLWLCGQAEPAAQGTLALRPHQRSAVERLRRMLREHGGALLADEVGLGKTYVGAAVARGFERVLVVAPATLRTMWLRALSAAGARGTVASYAMLSRGGGPAGPFDFLLLDEAHHARTPGTRRYARIAALADGARVLLLSATPIHNTRSDLAALLALFLGARAWALDDDAMARHVVRRERSDVAIGHIPETTAPLQLEVGDDEDLLRAILALPPPLPPRGAGDGGALLAWGLVRQWTSSNAALTGALRRRLVRASALDAALASGHLLSRRELAAWVCDDRAIQLAFPELLSGPPATDPARLRSALAEHEMAVRTLLERTSDSAWTDGARAERLREIRTRHPGEKVVAFTQFADTARALFRLLSRDAGVAVLTARGAAVAGGSLSRPDAIARFAPRASGATPPRDIERIDLLLATDLLSEGVNLHDASVVVHLDLPWTPARLEQRVGRSRRLGALHARTVVYALQPPTSSESLLRVEARLRAKLRTAGRALGAAGTILPALAGDEVEESAARRRELTVREIERWCRDSADDSAFPAPGKMLVAATRAPRSATLVLVREGQEYRLAAAMGDAEMDDAPAVVLDVVRLASEASTLPDDPALDPLSLRAHRQPAGGEPAPLDGAALGAADSALGAADSALGAADSALDATIERVDRWVARRAAMLTSGAALPPHTVARRHALRRIATIAARAPRHRRAEVARLAAIARRAATSPYGIGAERLLDALIETEMASGEEWLRTLGAFGDAHGAPGCGESGQASLLVTSVAVLVMHSE